MSDNKPRLSFQIPPSGLEELEQLARHVEKLPDISAAASAVPLGDDPAVVSAIATQVGIDPRDVIYVCTGLATLKSLMERSGVTAQELLNDLTSFLNSAAPPEWKTNNIQKWNAATDRIASVLDSLLADSFVFLRQKARELSYIHQNIYRSSRIITDLRPVFSAAADKIHAMVLTHILSIEYFDGVRRQRVEFALDDADVDELKRAAERARLKTETTKTEFNSHPSMRLIIAGSSSAPAF